MMIKNKRLYSFILALLIFGFPIQTSGMEKPVIEHEPLPLDFSTRINEGLSANEYYIKYLENRHDTSRYWGHKYTKRSAVNEEYLLGNIFFYGRGVPKDLVEAKYWLEKCTGHSKDVTENEVDDSEMLKCAQFLLVKFNLSLEPLTTLQELESSNSQIKENHESPSISLAPIKQELNRKTVRRCKTHITEVYEDFSITWGPIKLALKSEEACDSAQELYERGLNFYYDKNFTIAKELFKIAAGKKHPDAQYMLGILHQYGFGVPQSYEIALGYHKQVAAQNHAFAIDNIEAINNILEFHLIKNPSEAESYLTREQNRAG